MLRLSRDECTRDCAVCALFLPSASVSLAACNAGRLLHGLLPGDSPRSCKVRDFNVRVHIPTRQHPSDWPPPSPSAAPGRPAARYDRRHCTASCSLAGRTLAWLPQPGWVRHTPQNIMPADYFRSLSMWILSGAERAASSPSPKG